MPSTMAPNIAVVSVAELGPSVQHADELLDSDVSQQLLGTAPQEPFSENGKRCEWFSFVHVYSEQLRCHTCILSSF